MNETPHHPSDGITGDAVPSDGAGSDATGSDATGSQGAADSQGAAGSEATDTAFVRLQAADPAAGTTTDLVALEAAVGARIGATVTQLTPRTARRPARWLQLAAVVAGAAVIGGGAFALGRDGRPGNDTPAAPAIALSGTNGATTEGAASAAGPDRSAAGSSATDSTKLGYYGSRTVFTSAGLSDAGGTAEAWAFDAVSVFSAETAARAATALGLAGTPALVDGAWTLGSYDGVHPTLQLQPDATATLSYDDPAKNPYGVCPDASTGSSPGAAEATPGTSGDAVAPSKECTTDLGVAPSSDAATSRARELLAGFGLDAAAYEYETSDTGTPALASVTAWRVVAGQRTGQVASVNLTADGVQSVWVPLAPIVSLGSYPVVSENDAVARLGDARFGSGGGGVIAMQAGTVRSGGTATSSTLEAPAAQTPAVQTPTVPAVPSAGARFAWPVQHVTLTKARLGVTVYTQPDGSAVLLPAYELSDADGQSWSVIAVADDSLDFASAG